LEIKNTSVNLYFTKDYAQELITPIFLKSLLESSHTICLVTIHRYQNVVIMKMHFIIMEMYFG